MNTGTAAPPRIGHCDRGLAERSSQFGRPPRTGPDHDDRLLVAAVRAGDDRAFESLFERYRAPIGAYIAAQVRDPGYAEDVTQDVFISALRSLRMSEPPAMFRPWLYEIARNACIDRHRRTRRGEELAGGIDPQPPVDPAQLVAATAQQDGVIEARARFAELYATLLEMPAVDRKLLVMREFEGRSYREIVERSGLSAAAVESALFRARRRLIERTPRLRMAPRPHRRAPLTRSRPAGPPGAR